jgi:mono/diheme cytochrome c family protein
VRARFAKPLTAALALAAFAALAAACDLQEDADTETGRQLFVEQCGTCHALTEAATTATIGPDLDAAFAQARFTGMDNDTIEGVVEFQIANPRFTDPDDPTYMPADLVSGDDAVNVAAYVAAVAGVPGIEPPQVAGGGGAQVFADNGCGSCHALAATGSTGTIGPDLDEVMAGQDAEEIAESIVDPEATLASGFGAGVMPADYGQTISAEDLELLIELLLEAAGNGGGN